jgi:hypothetical protein
MLGARPWRLSLSQAHWSVAAFRSWPAVVVADVEGAGASGGVTLSEPLVALTDGAPLTARAGACRVTAVFRGPRKDPANLVRLSGARGVAWPCEHQRHP